MNCANYQRAQYSESRLNNYLNEKKSNMNEPSYGIEPSLIDKILRHYKSDFQACAKGSSSNKDELFTGTIIFSFVINHEGDVSEVHRDERVRPLSVMDCIEKVLKEIRYPKPRNKKPITVTKPLNFAEKK